MEFIITLVFQNTGLTNLLLGICDRNTVMPLCNFTIASYVSAFPSLLWFNMLRLRGHCIEFKYYADGIHSGLTPPGNNS